MDQLSRRLIYFALVGITACGGGTRSHGVAIHPMPDQGTFRGVWSSPELGELQLCDTDGHVIGQYTESQRLGVIQGDIEGDVLFFEWQEEMGMVRRAGHGFVRISPDGASHLDGEWGMGDELRGVGTLGAVKVEGAQPVHCYDGLRRL